MNEYVIERIKQYARDYPADILDFAECENEESVAASSIFIIVGDA